MLGNTGFVSNGNSYFSRKSRKLHSFLSYDCYHNDGSYAHTYANNGNYYRAVIVFIYIVVAVIACAAIFFGAVILTRSTVLIGSALVWSAVFLGHIGITPFASTVVIQVLVSECGCFPCFVIITIIAFSLLFALCIASGRLRGKPRSESMLVRYGNFLTNGNNLAASRAICITGIANASAACLERTYKGGVNMCADSWALRFTVNGYSVCAWLSGKICISNRVRRLVKNNGNDTVIICYGCAIKCKPTIYILWLKSCAINFNLCDTGIWNRYIWARIEANRIRIICNGILWICFIVGNCNTVLYPNLLLL